MSRLATSFVLGYHGCDRAVARKALAGKINLLQSDRPYDWLGAGTYFWESDPRRALEWATRASRLGKYAKPAVVGAIIDLRNCLDLMSREDVELVADAYQSFLDHRADAGLDVPVNRAVAGRGDSDNPLRFLDRAVIEHLHKMIDLQGQPPFDTVRGMFSEGLEVYPGSGFRQQSHVQIAVRNADCILGVFLPRPYPALA